MAQQRCVCACNFGAKIRKASDLIAYITNIQQSKMFRCGLSTRISAWDRSVQLNGVWFWACEALPVCLFDFSVIILQTIHHPCFGYASHRTCSSQVVGSEAQAQSSKYGHVTLNPISVKQGYGTQMWPTVVYTCYTFAGNRCCMRKINGYCRRFCETTARIRRVIRPALVG